MCLIQTPYSPVMQRFSLIGQKLFGYGKAAIPMVLCLLLVVGCSTSEKISEPDSSILQPEPEESLPVHEEVARWKRFIQEQMPLPIGEKLLSVNEFFNELEFVDDLSHWGKEDYWATPEEMLISGGGDCEDFTIAKYFTLKQLLVPEERMRLVYVKSLRLKQPHMVLSYYPTPKDDPLVLDNVVKSIVPASQRTDLIPVYSFNTEGLWVAKQLDAGQRAGDSTQLSLWQEFLARMGQGSAGN